MVHDEKDGPPPKSPKAQERRRPATADTEVPRTELVQHCTPCEQHGQTAHCNYRELHARAQPGEPIRCLPCLLIDRQCKIGGNTTANPAAGNSNVGQQQPQQSAMQSSLGQQSGYQNGQQYNPGQQQQQIPTTFGQNPQQYGQQQFGQNQFDQVQNPNPNQNQFGQSQNQFHQQQFGQPQLGQPQLGQSQFGQPQFGQPQFGQNPFGQNPYGQYNFGQYPFHQQFGASQVCGNYGPPQHHGWQQPSAGYSHLWNQVNQQPSPTAESIPAIVRSEMRAEMRRQEQEKTEKAEAYKAKIAAAEAKKLKEEAEAAEKKKKKEEEDERIKKLMMEVAQTLVTSNRKGEHKMKGAAINANKRKRQDDAPQPPTDSKLCRNWRRSGSCKWGDSCRFQHAADYAAESANKKAKGNQEAAKREREKAEAEERQRERKKEHKRLRSKKARDAKKARKAEEKNSSATDGQRSRNPDDEGASEDGNASDVEEHGCPSDISSEDGGVSLAPPRLRINAGTFEHRPPPRPFDLRQMRQQQEALHQANLQALAGHHGVATRGRNSLREQVREQSSSLQVQTMMPAQRPAEARTQVDPQRLLSVPSNDGMDTDGGEQTSALVLSPADGSALNQGQPDQPR
ncbi:DUF4333 domain-containing [Lecanosticta acicola]|uniref:DUF4333 domain-containing n=1 Tax=Lecanosticta acicola TaxID=111012 RepID=A0AAI8W0N2_9PEZI|nr:DUF4333 domain-containing [Lecanosticta acicola]